MFITTDQSLRHQQNLIGRRLAIMVLLSTDWRLIERHIDSVVAAVAGLTRSVYVEVSLGRPRGVT